MISIDGSAGEGGGQVLRTAASLSLVTGKAFRVDKVRAGREQSGLRPQHVAAILAAAEIGSAQVEGVAPGSEEFSFTPGEVRPGEYEFHVGTAGSATLVFQTVLPPLLMAAGPSRLTFEGGTHNAFAPPFDFLDITFLPLVRRMGPQVGIELERYGFYPPGGGRFHATVQPAKLCPIDIPRRGAVVSMRARALVANLPRNVGLRELAVVSHRLGWSGGELHVQESNQSESSGNALLLEIQSEALTEVVTSIGERGLRAEAVADKAATEASRYLSLGAPVGAHLADQLLLPMALAGGGSFVTGEVTDHTTTNADVIRRFLEIRVRIESDADGRWQVTVGG
jgi:RNA 3'-terminal phosphate cyclase (ATP)